jgi:hypothetical protein
LKSFWIIQYFLFFLLVFIRINRKVFQRVSKPHRVVHLRSMDFPNLVHTLVAISLCFVKVITKASRTWNCKRLNSEGISVGIIGIHGNSTSSPLNFPFKIVASMILFIIFFTGHLVTGHLVTWSLSHLVINFYERAHNKNAKFHYNHHRVQLVT